MSNSTEDKEPLSRPGDRLARQLESLRRKQQKRGSTSSPRGVQPTADRPARRTPETPGILYRRDVPFAEVRPSTYTPPMGRHLPLVQAVAGEEILVVSGGSYYRVERSLEQVRPEVAAQSRGVTGPESQVAGLRWDLPAVQQVGPLDPPLEQAELVFFDLETTGLSSSPLFLIGTLLVRGRSAVIRQFLARSYAEEASIISAFSTELRGKRLLVSFNGKSFDVPYLRARAAATRVPLPALPAHLDLLHLCRRLYGPVLPDCRLQTLERFICRRRRVEDIAGEHIPEAYHHFVRTGNAIDLAQILRHNAEDLATLLELSLKALGSPGSQGPAPS